MDYISGLMSPTVLMAINALFLLVVLVIVSFALDRSNKIDKNVNELIKNDWFTAINVDFPLNSTTELVKTFTIPKEHTLTSSGIIALSSATFPSGTTLTFKAASTLALLASDPDLQAEYQVEIFGSGGNDSSGTEINKGQSDSVSFYPDVSINSSTIYISLTLSHAPLTGGPLQIAFLGNYVNIAFDFFY